MQDSLNLALWTLGGWLALCLALVLPVMITSLLQERRRRSRASAGAAAQQRQGGRFAGKAGALFPVRAEPLPALSPAWSLPDALATQQTTLQTVQQTASGAYQVGTETKKRVGTDQPRRTPGIQMSGLSEVGRIHADQENEDSFLTITGARRWAGQLHPFGLCVVTDGVSGYTTGHEASRQTILAISQRFVPVLTEQDVSDDDLALLLAAAIQSANRALYQHNQRHDRPQGCTVTAALITDAQATICHVGKNRAYLLAEHLPLRRVTTDHSIVESLVVAGFIQRDEAYTHPKRNRIFRCLGQGPQVEVDTVRLPLTAGDRLLLCSDGLWELLRDQKLESALREYPDIEEANSHLLALAKEQGGVDDVTSILVQMTDAAEPVKRPGISQICSNQMHLAL